MQTSIDHIIIAVSDLERATDEYRQLLGRSPSWRGSHPDYGTANTLFKLDNTYIELLAAQGDGMAADIVNGILDERGPCLGGLVFGTEDAQTFIAHARSTGLPASDPMPGHGKDEQSGAERRWHNIFWDPAAARGIFSFCIQHDSGSTLPDATPMMGEPISGVDHVVVKTQSVEAAKRFYGAQLSIRLALEQHVPEWGGTQPGDELPQVLRGEKGEGSGRAVAGRSPNAPSSSAAERRPNAPSSPAFLRPQRTADIGGRQIGPPVGARAAWCSADQRLLGVVAKRQAVHHLY